MPEALSDARWAAIRALCEGEPPTHGRVAEAAGVFVKSLSRRAGSDKWKTLDFRHPRVRAAFRETIELAARFRAGEELDPVSRDADETEAGEVMALPELEPIGDESPRERIARMGEMLSRQADLMLRRAEAGRPLEGRQVSALSAMVQLAERIAVIAGEEEKKRIVADDDAVGEVLKKIDDQIVRLARGYARGLLVHHGMSEAEAEEALPPEEDG